MSGTSTWEVEAYNTDKASRNKIHDDAVARRFGFRGGLVPGVDVYAYLVHLPVEVWGDAWLERGEMRARFHRPVYDGERVSVRARPAGPDAAPTTLLLEALNPAGEVCATAEAVLPDGRAGPVPADHWPEVEVAVDPPPASPETLVPGTPFGIPPHHFVAARAGEYLDDVREDLPVFREGRAAHPGWILRDANYVLARNVVLGPWIHVASDVRHHAIITDGQVVATRAIVTREWEHKGHRFVELDVGVFADGAIAVRVTHTAIHAPRQAA
jgi:hypothetical protein